MEKLKYEMKELNSEYNVIADKYLSNNDYLDENNRIYFHNLIWHKISYVLSDLFFEDKLNEEEKNIIKIDIDNIRKEISFLTKLVED